jgi:hypothetical protein
VGDPGSSAIDVRETRPAIDRSRSGTQNEHTPCSGSTLGMSNTRSPCARLLRYLWALPTTCVGLLIAPAAMSPHGRISVVDGVLEMHSPLIAALLRYVVPIAGGAAAMTLGHVVIGRDESCLARTRCHERVHVRQCEAWGPAFIPAYLAAGLWGLISGKGMYQGNYFERQACRHELQARGVRI